MQVVKPFNITSVREDPDGYRMASFDFIRTIMLSPTTAKRTILSGAVRVPPGEDIEQYVWNDLQDPKWSVP